MAQKWEAMEERKNTKKKVRNSNQIETLIIEEESDEEQVQSLEVSAKRKKEIDGESAENMSEGSDEVGELPA